LKDASVAVQQRKFARILAFSYGTLTTHRTNFVWTIDVVLLDFDLSLHNYGNFAKK